MNHNHITKCGQTSQKHHTCLFNRKWQLYMPDGYIRAYILPFVNILKLFSVKLVRPAPHHYRTSMRRVTSEKLGRAFDVFTMIRKEGSTGFGISICQGIVTEHVGRICAKSESEKRAILFGELPLLTEKRRDQFCELGPAHLSK